MYFGSAASLGIAEDAKSTRRAIRVGHDVVKSKNGFANPLPCRGGGVPPLCRQPSSDLDMWSQSSKPTGMRVDGSDPSLQYASVINRNNVSPSFCIPSVAKPQNVPKLLAASMWILFNYVSSALLAPPARMLTNSGGWLTSGTAMMSLNFLAKMMLAAKVASTRLLCTQACSPTPPT